AAPAEVERHDAVRRLEVIELWLKVGVIAAPAVDEEEGRVAGALMQVMQLDSRASRDRHAGVEDTRNRGHCSVGVRPGWRQRCLWRAKDGHLWRQTGGIRALRGSPGGIRTRDLSLERAAS